MGFSHLFIFRLRSWSYGLGLLNLDSGSDLFNLLILDLLILDLLILDLLILNLLILDLLILDPLLQHLLVFDLLFLPLYPLAFFWSQYS